MIKLNIVKTIYSQHSIARLLSKSQVKVRVLKKNSAKSQVSPEKTDNVGHPPPSALVRKSHEQNQPHDITLTEEEVLESIKIF